MCQKHHNLPCFGSGNPGVAPSLGRFQNDDMASKDKPIEVSDEEEEQLVGAGPQNPEEVRSYREKVNAVFNTFGELLTGDVKDALQKTVTLLKRVMVKHWGGMAEADVSSVVKTIKDPSCLHLHQFLVTGGIEITEPASDMPEGWEFLQSLLKKTRKHEEQQLIISTFDHILEVMAHASMAAANISALGKITDPQMFDLVLKAAARPLVQINIPERYLSPVQDPKPASTADEVQQKLERKLLPHSDSASIVCEPKNSPTRLLAAALWLQLQCKYMNDGTAKEACTLFNMSPKSLSHIMSGKQYAGGRCKRSHTAAHEGDDTKPPTKKLTRHKTIVSPHHSSIYSEA